MRSTRLSRRAALAVGLSIVAIMVVWSPMLALANDSSNAADQSSVGTAPGLTGGAGNSASAPGHETEEVEVLETETETETMTVTEVGGSEGTVETFSNAGGNSNNSNAGGNTTNSNAGGNNTNSNAGGNGSTTPSGNGDGPGTGQGGNDCDGGSAGNGNGANTSGDFDNTCGTGGDSQGGKPCDGCVGNADDKNPPGQGNGDNNNGFECEPDDGTPGNGKGKGKGNKGVGGGNPAHTGCEDDDPLPCDPDNDGDSEWALTVSFGQTVLSADTQSQTYSTLPSDIIVTFTAATGYNTTGLVGGTTTATDTATFSETNCSDAVSYTFTRIQSGSDCESWGLSATVTNGTISAPSNMSDGYEDFDSSTPQSVTFTASEGYSSDGTETGATSVTKTAGAYSAFPGCAASVSMVFSEIGGEVLDCDGDGIADDVDPDTSSCEPDEPEEPELCPDGLPPDENGQCVRGIIINRPPKDKDKDEDPSVPDVADKTLGAPEAVAPSVLPFTGGNMLPFLMLSLGLIGTGGVAATRGRKKE